MQILSTCKCIYKVIVKRHVKQQSHGDMVNRYIIYMKFIIVQARHLLVVCFINGVGGEMIMLEGVELY